MSSGPAPSTETPLATPLPCWHESTVAARHDVIVALSERRARIASARPVPSGTPVFLEFRTAHPGGAGIDAVAVSSDELAFVVEFIAVDAGAAAVLAEALRPLPAPAVIIEPPVAPVIAPVIAAVLPAVASETPIHDEGAALDAVSVLGPPAGAPVPPLDVPATERTGEFLTSSLVFPGPAEPGVQEVLDAHDVDPADSVARTGEFLPIVAPTLAEPTRPVLVDIDVPGKDLPPSASSTTSPDAGPSWARALDADLGDEPDLGDVSHTQRWPTARLATSSEEELVTARTTAADAAASTAASTTPFAAGVEADPAPPMRSTLADAPTPGLAAKATPMQDERDETTRWPVARVAVNPEPPAAVPPQVAASAPPMDFDGAEDVVLEFTAPQRPAVTALPARPLPPPEDTGVVEVDFSEFRDVLGVATFRSESTARTALGQRVTTPQPISITLPRTPSTSLHPAPQAVVTKNPFGGDSGVGPRPDSTPPMTNPAPFDPAAVAPDQWVVSSPPSLPTPRLLDRDLDRVLRGGGSNSVTPRPIPMYDSSPPVTTPNGPAVPAPVAHSPSPATNVATSITSPPTSAGPDASPTMTPRVVAAARSPFAVPPVSPVVAPRPPSVVPVVVPPRPPVPVTLPPRPAMPSLGLSTPTVSAAPMAAAPMSVALPANATPPSSSPHAHLLPVTPSAEGLPLIVGADGDDP